MKINNITSILRPNAYKHIRPINVILATDGYKLLHHEQFPEGHTGSSYYGEPRIGGKYKEVTVAGLKYLCALLEVSRVTYDDFEEADSMLNHYILGEHGGWNREGWWTIVHELGGRLPVEIKVAPEGLIVPEGNVLYTVKETDPRFAWLPGALEGLTLQNAWYGTSVATHSRECLNVIYEYMLKTSDNMGKLPYMLNDFGFRGVSSYESSATGGYAHALNSDGTDTLSGVMLTRHLFPEYTGLAGYTIPAREHSTTTIYGTSLEGDKKAYENSIRKFGKGIYACVMDSVDYKASVKMVAEELKRDIVSAGGTFVARPDSGNACDNIVYALKTLGKEFGYTVNSKGYKVLNPSVAVIQGDGLDCPQDFRDICNWVEANGWSICNLAFGMGGGLLQKVDRDMQRFAQKMCSATIDGITYDVYKATPGKESKAGEQMLYRNKETGEIFTERYYELTRNVKWERLLFTGFINGYCVHDQSYESATANARIKWDLLQQAA